MTEVVIIYSTFSNMEEANKMASFFIDSKLAACVNILSPITSFYKWNDKTESGTEVAAIIKTTQDKVQSLEKEFITLHSYECPCFIVIKAEHINELYADWIKTSLA